MLPSIVWITLIKFLFISADCFIIPDEVPSLLSVIYSNIPVLKKGTDSRLGWGFRLGDRADFQVLVELGPQIYTQKLANQEDSTSSNNKRNTLDTLANTLYAQRQKDKHEKIKTNQAKTEANKSEGGKWLEDWSKSMSGNNNNNNNYNEGNDKLVGLKAIETIKPKPGLAIGEIDAKSVIPDDATLELIELLKKRQNSEEVTTEKNIVIEKTTEAKLDDVEIEE